MERVPLKYRGPIKINNQIRHVYLTPRTREVVDGGVHYEKEYS